MADSARHPAAGPASAVAASLTALLLAAPSPRAAVTALADAGSSSDVTGPLVAVVALAAWAVSGWLALTVLAVLLSRLPGLLGRAGRTVAGRLAPATVRRGVEAALGLTVVVGALAPAGAHATLGAGPQAGPAAAVAGPGVETAWDLDWPASATPPTAPSHARTTAPTPAAPTDAARTDAAPIAPPSRPGPATPPVRPTAAIPAVVVVQAGDSLWSLAEAALRSAGTADPTDCQVARAWPRWWAANREVVGDDPDLLLPGTVLRPPPGTPGP